MTRTGYFVRLAISIAIDVLDMTVGRALFIAPGADIIGAGILFLLWGPSGLIYLWELADVTEQIDGFVPTATMIGLYHGWRSGLLTGKTPPQSPGTPPPSNTNAH